MRYLTLVLPLAAFVAALSFQAPRSAHAAEAPFDVYDGGLKNGWQDWGWAHREIKAGAPAILHLDRYAGWILAHRDLKGPYVSLSFSVRAPKSFGHFLEVSLGSKEADGDTFPKVALEGQQSVPQANGFTRYTISMQVLNPGHEPFDRIKLHAIKALDNSPVEVDGMSLMPAAPGELLPEAPKPVLAKKPVHLVIDCRAPQKAISPLIYGIAFSPRKVGQDAHLWDLHSSIRRWGGNPASRYNWRLGNAWNTASDWFFKNVNYTNVANYSWTDFLAENAAHNTQAAMTVPMLGWVAKDTSSYSFSVAAQGPQQYTAGDQGNGVKKGGAKVPSPDPKTTSVEASPQDVGAWVRDIEAWAAAHQPHGVPQYILDNEPALWNSTHRDVHPSPLTYDELLHKTVAYGSAVRKAAPKAEIAGPAEWGWPAYFYSAQDAEVGFRIKPDRRAHGDVPLLEWYLQQLKRHSDTTGEHLLDVLDLHYYPQTSGVYGRGEENGPKAARTRIRATRSLWDPTFQDESWIADKIALLPRMQALIDNNYPGRKISIGEYNFGGEKHISGALALAESLGRFGQAGVHSAYMWTYPAAHTPAFAAFSAFRNYDGHGLQFPDRGLKTQDEQNVSTYAAKDADGKRLVAIALNLNDDFDAAANIELRGCGAYTHVRAFGVDGTSKELHALEQKDHAVQSHIDQLLPGYSITVIELTR